MKVLLVVDMQQDFIDGALGTPEARVVVDAVAEKVNKYSRMKDSIVVYTRDTHYEDYMETAEGKSLPVPHCIYGTEGWEIDDRVINQRNANVILDKLTFGKHDIAEKILDTIYECYNTHKIESIEIVGLCTDICVISNALILKANLPETPIYVDSKCCAGVTPEKHEAALEVMRSCQITVL